MRWIDDAAIGRRSEFTIPRIHRHFQYLPTCCLSHNAVARTDNCEASKIKIRIKSKITIKNSRIKIPTGWAS